MSRRFPFHSLLLAQAFLLAACTGSPSRPNVAVVEPQPLDQMTVAVDAADVGVMGDLLQAELALAGGDLSTAAQAYSDAAAQSTDPRVAQMAADLAIGQADVGGAEAAVERMRTTGAPARTVARERARAALLRGHRDEARDELKKILAPGDDQAWREFARVLAEARDPALAGTLLEELATAETLPADRPETWIAMSQLGERLNRHLYAESLAEQAEEHFHNAQTMAWLGHLKLTAGEEDEGLALYAEAIAKAPDDSRLRQVYAAALGELGRNREALDVLRGGAEDDLTILTGRAAYAARLDDSAELGRVYALLKRNQDGFDSNIDYFLGQLAEMLEQPEEALGYYANVPADDEHAFDSIVRRAILLAQQGHPDQAHALARGLQRDYADDEDSVRRAFMLEAQLYLRDGDNTGAVDSYDRGLQQLPDDIDLLYGRAISQADSGNGEAAITDLRRVLELEPDNIDAVNALGYTLADENRDLDEAEHLLRRALEQEPDEPAIIDSWGWLQYRQGQLNEAEASLRKAWQLREDPDIGMHLGEVLWKLGRKDEARKLFEQLRADHPDHTALDATLKRLQQ